MLLAASLAACGGGTRLGRAGQLFVVDGASGERRQLTDDERSRSSPAWSPDGRRVAVVSAGSEAGAIEVVRVADGATRVVLRRRGFIQGLAWSPRGGGELAFVRPQESTLWTVETVQADGSRPQRLARHRSVRVVPAGPAWSPEGNRVAYAAGTDVFVVPRNGGPRRIATNAWAPRWSPDGEVVLVVRRHALVATPVGRGRPRRVAGRLIAVSGGDHRPARVVRRLLGVAVDETGERETGSAARRYDVRAAGLGGRLRGRDC